MGLEKEQALSISHGRTRNLTEKEEAETRKNIDTAGEAFATDGHGISRKEEYKAEQEWNPAFARLTKAAGTLPSFSRRRESRNTGS